MYADYTHITYASADLHLIESTLNRDLSNIHKWSLCNKLTLNTTTTLTQFMLIGSRQNMSRLSESFELSIDNVPIKKDLLLNHLGLLLIDDNMAWQSHIEKLSKKIAPGIGAIKRIGSSVSPAMLYYITSTMPSWYNTISITIVLSGGTAAKCSQKNYKTCRIVLLAS